MVKNCRRKALDQGCNLQKISTSLVVNEATNLAASFLLLTCYNTQQGVTLILSHITMPKLSLIPKPPSPPHPHHTPLHTYTNTYIHTHTDTHTHTPLPPTPTKDNNVWILYEESIYTTPTVMYRIAKWRNFWVGMFVGGARLVTCVTFVLTGPLSLGNALRQRCYPQECIRATKTIDERTVVRRTNTNNMQGWQIPHWELSSAGLIKAYKFTISEIERYFCIIISV